MNIEHLLNTYGYLALFIGTFAEGESVLVLGGILAHSGHLELTAVIVTAFVAAVLGNQLYFYLGRRHAQGFLRRFPRLTIIALLLFPLISAIRADTWAAFAYEIGSGELGLLVNLVLIVFVWRFNPVAIFVSYVGLSLIISILFFVEKGGPVYRRDGIILLVLSATASIAAWQYGRRIQKDYLPPPTPA